MFLILLKRGVIELKNTFWDWIWNVRDIEAPLKMKRSSLWLIEGDLFQLSNLGGFIVNIYEAMAAAQQHTFIVLTDHPERIIPVLYGREANFYLGGGDFLENIWHLTRVDNQEIANKRIPELLKLREISTGWPVLGVVVKPVLGPLDLTRYLPEPSQEIPFRINYLNWVICNGGSQPAIPEWVRSIRDQCQATGVPFYFEGWGEWKATYRQEEAVDLLKLKNNQLVTKAQNGGYWLFSRVGEKKAGYLLDGQKWREYPLIN
ncbi:MAG: DUF5131 family protein [Firmicutes bacterium]|nr:DUF5131 family protein [Bacillota bacterium]